MPPLFTCPGSSPLWEGPLPRMPTPPAAPAGEPMGIIPPCNPSGGLALNALAGMGECRAGGLPVADLRGMLAVLPLLLLSVGEGPMLGSGDAGVGGVGAAVVPPGDAAAEEAPLPGLLMKGVGDVKGLLSCAGRPSMEPRLLVAGLLMKGVGDVAMPLLSCECRPSKALTGIVAPRLPLAGGLMKGVWDVTTPLLSCGGGPCKALAGIVVAPRSPVAGLLMKGLGDVPMPLLSCGGGLSKAMAGIVVAPRLPSAGRLMKGMEDVAMPLLCCGAPGNALGCADDEGRALRDLKNFEALFHWLEGDAAAAAAAAADRWSADSVL